VDKMSLMARLFGWRMTNRVFNSAFDLLMDIEGGYVCDKDDDVGETKYGISKKSYPNEDICNLTLERAKEIYKRDYWDRCKCDQLPDCLSVALFDFAVNSPAKTAIKKLQKALGVTQDGIIGNQTIGAANRLNPRKALQDFMDLRTDFIIDLVNKKPKNKKFKNGWLNRIERVRKYCEELV
jgi:lysozyme family protein